MRDASVYQVPLAVSRYMAGGEAVSKPSLYAYAVHAEKLKKAIKAGFRTVAQYEKAKFEKSCLEFEKMLGIGRFPK